MRCINSIQSIGFWRDQLYRSRTRKKLCNRRITPAQFSIYRVLFFWEKRKRWFNLNSWRLLRTKLQENARNIVANMLKQRRNTWTIVPTRHFPFLSLFFSPFFSFILSLSPLRARQIENRKTWLLHIHTTIKGIEKVVKKKATIFYYDFLFEDTGNSMMNTSIITLSFLLLSCSMVG